MFWLSFWCVIVVALIIINLKLEKRCKKELKDSSVCYENKVPMVFYNVSDKLLKRYETFSEETKELKTAYEGLLSLKKRNEEGKEGLDGFFKKWRGHLLGKVKKINELKEVDKKKYEKELEICNKNWNQLNIYYENYLNGEFFDYDKLLEDVNQVIDVRKLFNGYFIKIEKERKILNEKIAELNKAHDLFIKIENSILDEKKKINISIADVEKQNKALCDDTDMIKKESEDIEKEIKEMEAQALLLDAKRKALLKEHRKLKNATTEWEYF